MDRLPVPFMPLFRESWALARSLWVPAFLGMLLFGVTSIVLQLLMNVVALPVGQDSALQFTLVGVAILAYIASMVLGFVLQSYLLLLGVLRRRAVFAAVREAFFITGRVIAVSFWSFIKSYVWIVFIGFLFLIVGSILPKGPAVPFHILGFVCFIAGLVVALIRGPRLSFSMMILLREGLSARASVQTSFDRTEGRWGTIVGKMLLLSLIFLLIMAGCMGVLGILFATTVYLAYQQHFVAMIFSGAIGTIAMIALGIYLFPIVQILNVIFMTQLGERIGAVATARA